MRAEAMVLLKDALNSQLDPDLVAPAARPEGVAARRREAYFAAVAARHAAGARTGQERVGVSA
jgi:RNA polymerase sigma factor for flagellar operon FliA